MTRQAERWGSDGGVPARICLVSHGADAFDYLFAALRLHGFELDALVGDARSLHLSGAGSLYELIILDTAPSEDDADDVVSLIASIGDQRVMVLAETPPADLTVRCLDAGAVDCLAKPVPLEELVARVRAHVRRTAAATDVRKRFLRLDDLTLDLEEHVVYAGNRRAPLSRREFALLVYLMRRPGEGCSREQILAEVWGIAFDPGTNVVAVYIRRLRHKLGDGWIQTCRNAGYTLRSRDRVPTMATPVVATNQEI
jgi:DNA-binding response OmpR family regulator